MSDSTKMPLVVITGASSGIGEAAARRFLQAGYRLALLARRQERLDALQRVLGEAVSIYPIDVTVKESVFQVIDKIETEVGPIDILINNAGCGFGLEPAYECNIEEWEQCVDVNINGLLYITRAALPHMVQRNKGHIINIGSIAGTYPYPGGNVYGSTKAFVSQFSLNLRADLLGTAVRVSCIEPGLVAGTEFFVKRFRGDEIRAEKVSANTLPLLPEDIAETIYFCTAMPAHANINRIEIMPVVQASAALAIHRN
jgi:3-hydroxy acid dehydrogenase / malonic semialdehyde reductase